MEHNEYAVWRCKLQIMQRQYIQDGMEMNFGGYLKVLLNLTIVAPKAELGRALLKVHFDEAFRMHKPLENDKHWEYVTEPIEEKIDNIIRYEDAYRGRL